jgi:hypothetical protein
MKVATLVIGIAIAMGGAAEAQNTPTYGGASAGSSASVTADRNGASARQQTAASAGATSANDSAAAQVAQGSELNATLARSVDAGRAKPGDAVTATLSQHYESNGHVMLRRGTRLVGHVTEARPRPPAADVAGQRDSRLGIVFDKAVLEDGREVPVYATIQAVAAAESRASSGADGLDGAIGGGAVGAGRASAGGLGAVAGGVAGSVGGALGGIGRVGNGVDTAAGAIVGATHASAGSIGGIDAAGRLKSGSRGVFGMRGIEVTSIAAGSVSGSVLTSRARDVELARGTQMLLVSQASGGVDGAVQGSPRAVTTTGSAVSQGAVQAPPRQPTVAGSAAGSAAGAATIRR